MERGSVIAVTFQDQLRLLSGRGTARSVHTGSCHDLTALKHENNHTHTIATCPKEVTRAEMCNGIKQGCLRITMQNILNKKMQPRGQ